MVRQEIINHLKAGKMVVAVDAKEKGSSIQIHNAKYIVRKYGYDGEIVDESFLVNENDAIDLFMKWVKRLKVSFSLF